MSKIAVSPNGSGTGTYTLASPNNNASHTITLPVATGELLVNTSTGVDVTGTVTADGLTLGANNANSPQILFENSDGVTGDAAISTYDDSLGTMLVMGSNFYINSSGSESRFNTSEESSAVLLNRNGDLNLLTGGTGATATIRLKIDASGKVGIGTNSPSHKAHISTTDSAPLNVEHSNGTDVYIKLSNTADGAGNFLGADSNNLTFWTENTERMRISSTGVISGDGSGLTGVGASTATGAVGTYAWLGRNSGSSTLSAGSTYAGSGLRYAGAGQYSWAGGNTAYSTSRGGAPAGTWRAMGTCTSSYSTVSPSTIFVRIS